MVDKELIENWRNMVKPSISSLLFKTNYEGMGEQDKEEFERDFDEILDLALIGLERTDKRTDKRTESHACDCISRQDAIRWIKTECNPYGKPTLDFESGKRVMKHLEQMPPVQPEITQEQLEEYCKKRCLTVITDDLFYKLTSGSKNTATWLIRKWGDDAKCSNCGRTFKDVYDMDNHDRFCRFCGNKMEGIETIK